MAVENGELIKSISVSGYKSIAREQSIELRPLTILAGANSSGKSSIIQPLLLFKQTLESGYDPAGAFLLDGPNVRMNTAEQIFSQLGAADEIRELRTRFELSSASWAEFCFRRDSEKGVELEWVEYSDSGGKARRFRLGMSDSEILEQLRGMPDGDRVTEARISRWRCFFQLSGKEEPSQFTFRLAGFLVPVIHHVIHVPGIRANRGRGYPFTGHGPNFPGVFQDYSASVILNWQSSPSSHQLDALNDAMQRLDLTSEVEARRLSEIEIRVGRLPHAERGGDLVNIADVELGVSQVLHVVVALLAARPGDLLYLEEPEIHLHPRAQVRLARILAGAAKRGVVVVAETHSSLLLTGIQTMVAQGELDPSLVKLHWFQRHHMDGSTSVRSADLDREGAFGNWPMDFDDVLLNAEKEYLDAAETIGKR